MEELEYIGTISGPRGFKGEMTVKDVPPGIDGIKKDSDVFIGFSANFSTKYTCIKWINSHRKSQLQVKEISDEKQVKLLKEKGIFVSKSNIFKPQGKQLRNDLINCQVKDLSTNEFIGKIIDIWFLPGNDVWLCETERGELPIPVVDDVIKKVDTDNQLVEVFLPDGIWDLVE